MDRYLPRLSESGRRWARFFGLLAAVALLVWIALVLRQVLTPIVAALALAYILNPLVTLLEQNYRIRRVISISAGLALLLIVGISLLAAGTAQVVQLAGNIPGYASQTFEWLDETIPGLFSTTDKHSAAGTRPGAAEEADEPSAPATTFPSAERGPDRPSSAQELARTHRDQLTQLVKDYGLTAGRSVIGYIARIVSNAFYWLSLTVLLPIYTFFFLLHFNEIVRTIRDHLPSGYRPTIVRVASTIDGAVSTFFRGRLLVCLAVGTLTGIGWLIVGVPYNLALGALAGVLNLVPFMSVLALPPALILTYLDAADAGGNWVVAVTLVVGVYLAVQALESFVLTPVIEARASGLHPITTVIALLIGGQLAGLLGMLLAIPITSTLKSLVAEYALPEIRRLATRQAETPAPSDALVTPPQEPATDRPTGPIEATKPGDAPAQDKS
ncbi:MAG: AI-2E family transporter [Phycisphaerae bacterium]